jgi:hypothetical protein
MRRAGVAQPGIDRMAMADCLTTGDSGRILQGIIESIFVGWLV